MGARDLLKPVLERQMGGTVHFGRVAVKPGKPTTFATVPFPLSSSSTVAAAAEGESGNIKVINKPVFALPGNPASALVTFYLFVVPALRRLGGWPEELAQLPRVPVIVRVPVPPV
jgi:gephyrin